MARMIDPSTLEGEELFNWYRRSPADVEAEREAARQAQYDAFVKSIRDASGSQESPAAAAQDGDAIEGSSDRAGGNSRNGRFVKAGYFEPPMPAVMAPPEVEPRPDPMIEVPSGQRVGPTVDAKGGPVIGGSPRGFFATHDYSDSLGGYFDQTAPFPLNRVQATGTHWWDLADHTRVKPEEVERIYAEQQRRLNGQDKSAPQPAGRLHVVNKWADGQIPKAEQVALNERELDPTCGPYGGWERDLGYATNSDLSKLYQAQISRAPGLEYVVRVPGQDDVRFDGCAVWDRKHPLLEAKGPRYAPLIANAQRSKSEFFYNNMRRKDARQAARQAAVAAPNQRIEWHVAEPGAFSYFKEATEKKRPPIVVQVTPPNW